ncbi:UDP-glucuronosyl/UDP-glucosyltransferase [Artemisia annua]|uniref:UDP-glucuronosyl/UDP-glucosyltransferase n=1 Tax=Artemisia annua TaxID=35608 RepID=A0A2U1QM63_ARTAN|nr:UDP-glucuronosyl/UDP-glucosyltransferase [Artemisia annua]
METVVVNNETKKPHVVCIPVPAQSHIKCMLKLARVLHHKGLEVTFVNTQSNHKRLLKSAGSHDLEDAPGFHFKTVPDGLPSTSDADNIPSQTWRQLSNYLATNFFHSFLILVSEFETPVTCIISDGLMNFAKTYDVAKTLNVPIILYWTLSTSGFMGYYQAKVLVEKGLVPLKGSSITKKDTNNSNFNGYSLWKEEPECIQWLLSKEPTSVVYVNFGSLALMSLKDLIEFGWGLVNSNHYFLWIIRTDLVDGGSLVLPPELEEGIKRRGFIASWCSQEEMCKEWEVGMEIGKNVSRHEVEKLVRELMDGIKGKRLRMRAMEWKTKAKIATALNGSSTLNIEGLVHEITMLSRN